MMSNTAPNTPLEAGGEAELEKQLKVFQDYTASFGYPMNQEAHYKGIAIFAKRIRALIAKRERAARISEWTPLLSSGDVDLARMAEDRIKALEQESEDE